MAKSKYQSHVLPRFNEISEWVKQGAQDKDIYERLGISKQAFYVYKEKYVDFKDILKKNLEYCTDKVENALYEKALKGDVVAQIFWLKNRRPDLWKEKPEHKKDDGKSKLDTLVGALNNLANGGKK